MNPSQNSITACATVPTRHPLLRLAAVGLSSAALVALTACSSMSPSARDTAIGATTGAAVGGVLTGTTTGAAVGAAVGGMIGNEVSKRR